MEDKRKYHIIIGSKAYFDASLPDFSEEDEVDTFLELVKLSDAAKQSRYNFDQHVNCQKQQLSRDRRGSA